jgi:hypothetical protein
VLDDDGAYIGFDVVIGNPPYISMSKIKDQSSYFCSSNYVTYSKGADIYCLFYELGGGLLKNQGFLTYITSNSWLRAIYGNLLKTYFVKHAQPISLLNIEDVQIFEEATVESNIITLQKGIEINSFYATNLASDYAFGSDLKVYFDSNNFEFIIPETQEWFIGNQDESLLKLKIESNAIQLKEFDIKINFGIKTGYNEAFIISAKTKEKLIAKDSNNTEIIKPILRGRDLKKYSYEFNDNYLINSHNGIKSSNVERVKVQEDFPSIYSFLATFKPKVNSRYDQGDDWTNLRNCAYLNDFNKPKIIWGEICDKPKFAYDDGNFYAEATTFFMTGEKLKFLLAILNSNLSEWYFNLIGTTTGMGTNRWKKYKIELLPIASATDEQENQIESLVTQILDLKKEDAAADTTGLEAEIDAMVYALYGLSEEEIKIVEGL